MATLAYFLMYLAASCLVSPLIGAFMRAGVDEPVALRARRRVE
jgi:hypothetical protein